MGSLAKAERCALDWLRERRDKNGERLISDEEYAAGDRLRRDFMRARLGQRVTTDWTPVPKDRNRGVSQHVSHRSESASEAGERVQRVLREVGPDCAGILMDVCCFELKLRDVERKAGWPQRSGKVILQLALRQLARSYGYIRDTPAEPSVSRVRHWAVEDYRPGIDGGKGGEDPVD